MWKMCPFHFGLLLCALCVTTQVVSQNLTQVNATASTNTNTTQQPYSSSTNSTSPTGAGAGLRSGGIGALLAPVLLALHRYC
ncbi:unnamed protein product [Knipowitschia caucasica]|uniref:Uncharacterized protein n=1 Tax=Knipowitschia caucasica TaxID=637954 RepID=A0AAV2K9L4_KNICA